MTFLRIPLSLFVAEIAISLLPAHLRAADDASTMVSIRAAHRSARESLRTFSADFRTELLSPQPMPGVSGTYRRKLDIVRANLITRAGDTHNWLVDDKEVRQLGASPKLPSGRQNYVARRTPKTVSFGHADVWPKMLIDIYGPDGKFGRLNYDQFIDLAKKPPRTRREQVAGVDCVRVSMSVSYPGGQTDYVLWHDVTRNYLIRKLEMTHPDASDYRFEAENVEFSEPEPGVFAPTRCVRRTWSGDQYNDEAIVLSNVVVNKPIPDQIFILPSVQPGTEVSDEIRGTRYPINDRWERIGPEVPYTKLTVAGPPTSEDGGFRSQSEAESPPVSRWILLGSCGMLAAVGAAWLFRWYRRRRTES